MTPNDFDTIWLRVKLVTGWKQQNELAEYLGIKAASVSGAKKEGVFRESWLEQIADETGVYVKWLLTGERPKYIDPEKEDKDEWDIENGGSFTLFNGQKGTIVRRKRKPKPEVNKSIERISTIPHMPSDSLGMAEGMTILGRIYGSGDQVFIRAINANLHAFNAALDNKEQVQKSAEQISQMESRMGKLEERLTALEEENKKLKKRPPGCTEQAAG